MAMIPRTNHNHDRQRRWACNLFACLLRLLRLLRVPCPPTLTYRMLPAPFRLFVRHQSATKVVRPARGPPYAGGAHLAELCDVGAT